MSKEFIQDLVFLCSMKVIILCILIFFTALPMSAQLDKDKVLHFGAGAVSGIAGAIIADKVSDGDPYWRFAGALTASLLAGLAKEAYDENKYKGWDNRDLAATVLGGITAGVTFNIFSKNRKKRKNKVVLNSF